MSKITSAKSARGRLGRGTHVVGFRPPAAKTPRQVEYKGIKFIVWVSSPDQVINIKKAYLKLVRESNAEYLQQQKDHGENADTA